jgi:hypothetical protein
MSAAKHRRQSAGSGHDHCPSPTAASRDPNYQPPPDPSVARVRQATAERPDLPNSGRLPNAYSCRNTHDYSKHWAHSRRSWSAVTQHGHRYSEDAERRFFAHLQRSCLRARRLHIRQFCFGTPAGRVNPAQAILAGDSVFFGLRLGRQGRWPHARAAGRGTARGRSSLCHWSARAAPSGAGAVVEVGGEGGVAASAHFPAQRRVG